MIEKLLSVISLAFYIDEPIPDDEYLSLYDEIFTSVSKIEDVRFIVGDRLYDTN